jgi:hypothetical protein
MYNKDEILQELQEIGAALKKPVLLFLIGGGAMSLRNLKQTTKDIDAVVLSRQDLDGLIDAFEELNFKPAVDVEEEIYLTATAVFMKEESRIDIFLKEVCKKLQISPAMQSRAFDVGTFGKLTVKAACNEDIFLFKAMAVESEREHDIDDCEQLFLQKLNWNIIAQECVSQHREHVKWIFWLFEFICRFEDSLQLEIPIKDEVFALCLEDWHLRPDDFLYQVEDVKKHVPKKNWKDIRKSL